uniref:SAGA-associated factor 11 n=1 Tax=Globodera rostochiensis TaxID=31243 RepID=A0A914H645_GLORO
MEKRRSRGELLDNEDAIINTEMIGHLTEAVIENVFVALMFQTHRNIAINKLIGLREELESDQVKEEEVEGEEPAVNNNGTRNNNNGTTPRGKRQNGRNRGAAECKCKCFVCHQLIAAVRFAPHLEKCIGIGRAARSRRRGVNNFMSVADVADLSSSPGRSTRSSTLRSATRRLIDDGAGSAAVAAATTSSPPAHGFLGRRLPFVEEDFTLPPTSTTTATAIKESATTLCGGGGAANDAQTVMIKEEEEDEGAEELIQRVSRASVVVDQELISSVGRGLCVLVGMCREDGDEDIEYIVRKLLNLRLFEHPQTQKRWDVSVKELGLDILCVSQVSSRCTRA